MKITKLGISPVKALGIKPIQGVKALGISPIYEMAEKAKKEMELREEKRKAVNKFFLKQKKNIFLILQKKNLNKKK